MYCEDTLHNLFHLMTWVGTMKKEQILRYFHEELDEMRTGFLLDQMEIRRIIQYDESSDTYRYMGSAKYTKHQLDRLIKALWCVADVGSVNILTIRLTEYPTSLFYVTNDDETRDITVVESANQALLAQRVRSENLARGVPDFITHYAVLRRAEDEYMLKNAGFDYYCLIDPITHNVKTVQLHGN